MMADGFDASLLAILGTAACAGALAVVVVLWMEDRR